ncbi:unnamed protein product, partial [Didymodactylos carnosus]
MDFGSKYVYNYSYSSEEELSDSGGEDHDEIQLRKGSKIVPSAAADGDVTVSTVSTDAALDTKKLQMQEKKNHLPHEQNMKQKRRLRKADTNVLSVQFNRLLQPTEMHAGDFIKCSGCTAIASHLSKITPQQPQEKLAAEEEEQIPSSRWLCEFCNQSNSTDIEQNDLPKQEDATYLVQPAPVVHGSDMSGVDNSIVFFLIDISGSMSTTTLVNGTFQMPNAQKQKQYAAEHFDGAQMIRQHRQTHVTRLQGVQMAVDANLDNLVKVNPTRRAALLTFNHELTYYGDGTRDPLIIRGDKLNSEEELRREAAQANADELKPIKETKKKLIDRVYDLEEGGQTALGSAVIFALNVASKRQGSKIVICTDGMANRGLGNLETANDEKSEKNVRLQAIEEGNQFYGNITAIARDKGVSISVITIK